MNGLDQILKMLGNNGKSVVIRGLTYDCLKITEKGTYLFSHSASSECLETQYSFLEKLYQEQRLFDPNQQNVKPKINLGISARAKIKIQTQPAAVIQSKYGLTSDEAKEMELLLQEVRPLKFIKSKQLSNYIVQHKLGYKYPTISGVARMSNGDREWDFDGGFPREIYKIVCQELDLRNQGSRSWVVGFSSFGSMK